MTVTMEQVEQAIADLCFWSRNRGSDLCPQNSAAEERGREALISLIRQYDQDNSVAERERCHAALIAAYGWATQQPSCTWQQFAVEVERRINSGEQPS